MRSNLSDNPTSIQTDLSTILGDQVPSYNLVARWVACFKEVQEDVEYKGRNYRFIQANIAFVRSLIEGPFQLIMILKLRWVSPKTQLII